MIYHTDITHQDLKLQIQNQAILYGGNTKLKIYGLLTCASGKRMKREHRVFFATESEALDLGYRPCGHCMHHAYKNWKHVEHAIR
jgi:methylphosphotriester-DNA--protein-cysteine methyltransferase